MTESPNPLDALHGGDAALKTMCGRLLRLINSRVNIIIGGETGTGKEYLARMIHDSSARADKPFVAINCAALPESLIESELFGYEQGAFTGSKRGGRKGLIEQANGGTLFLDEIGDMPLLLQSRLLRVLAEKELYPLGSSKKINLDLHVVSATHQDLKTLIAEGLFRADLYYRLSGAEFVLPPLRERGDFDWLVRRLLVDLQQDAGSVGELRFEPELMQRLRRYDWPGNIRELKNLLGYFVAVWSDTGGLIGVRDLPQGMALLPEGTGQLTSASVVMESPAVSEVAVNEPDDEAEQLRLCLQRLGWNVSAAAREMGVARMTVYRRMKRLGVVLPNWVG